MKTWTLPWTPLLLVVAALLALAPAVFADVRIATSASDGAGRRLDQSTGLVMAAVAFTVLAAIVTGSGLRSGELRLAAGAIPRRGVLAAAQLGALALVVLAASATLFTADALIRTWTDPRAPAPAGASHLRAGAGCCATAITFTPLCAALTLAVRNPVVPVAVLVLTPMLLLPWLDRTAPAVLTALPYAAASAVIRERAGAVLSVPSGFLLLLAWSALSALLFATTLTRRDL